MTQEPEFPVKFTPRQLERLQQAIRESNKRVGSDVSPDDHNLERKLLEYCSTARVFPRMR